MTRFSFAAFLFGTMLFLAAPAAAQPDDICREFGEMPSLDSPFARIPYVFGKITVQGLDATAKFPKITVKLAHAQRDPRPITVNRSGNYCFRLSGNNATLIIEVDGVEVSRRSIPSTIGSHHREDFDIFLDAPKNPGPGVVSAKFNHPRSDAAVELLKKAAEASNAKDRGKAIGYLKEALAADPADFIAWAQLGVLHFEGGAYVDADAAFRRSLELRQDYTPAWVNVGKLRMAQKQTEAAIEIFKHAASLEPANARIYQLLGEAYLQNRQGSLAVQALDEALRLDPVGMAESHLRKAQLYDLAGAKHLAANEYKVFLEKVPEYPERKRLEKYIAENPEK